MYATRYEKDPAGTILLGAYGGGPPNVMGDVSTTSKGRYGAPVFGSLVIGAPMRGAMCPFDCPFFLARLLWTRSVRRAACSVAHCTASLRASSSDAGTPVVASADAGASSTAVMMNSLRFWDSPHTAARLSYFCGGRTKAADSLQGGLLTAGGGGRRAAAG